MSVPPFYADLTYPGRPDHRPYVVINMVATIDGKIVLGERGEPVQDLGSDVDHLMMRRIQNSTDAVLIGARNQRSTPRIWYPKNLTRVVATRSGSVLYPSRFFDDAPEKAVVLCTDESQLPELPHGVRIARIGQKSVDWPRALEFIKDALGVNTLLVEGGSEINARLFECEAVDEMFLTIAPKIKLGEDIPTIADGNPLPREKVQQYKLLKSHVWDNEIFLRYQRNAN